MTCDFASSLTVYQSYQGDGKVIMKAFCNRTCLPLERFPPPAGLELGTLDQKASAQSTELPGLLNENRKVKVTIFIRFRKGAKK